ncbi:TIGR02147 family protein [Bdellovibrio sp. HCB274]|uniref:TIGR02147 family protein n=1 Tax=Bdellovibrio sp. HCB274 TaxID=3394361 RepID=UPI0039B36531
MSKYDYTDYKLFLKSKLVRGSQVQLAEHIGVQPAFLSQVLRGKPHLSLEQGVLISEFYDLSELEQEYFMLALQYGRSGSTKLSSYFLKRMQNHRNQHQSAQAVIGKHETLDDVTKSIFFSSWKYALIHVLTSIPSGRQHELLKKTSGLSEKEIENTLNFLMKSGLVEKKNDRWYPSKKRIHLGPQDLLIANHHKNFRALTANALESIRSDSLHYSSAIALSEEDAQKIKSLLLDAISKVEQVIRPSPEETVRIFSMDFFGLKHEL